MAVSTARSRRRVDAAGSFKAKKKNAKVKAIVKVKPGKYVEGVVLDGTKKKKDFDGLTIMGTKSNPRKTILEGKNAKGELGPAQNGIEAISVDGVVLEEHVGPQLRIERLLRPRRHRQPASTATATRWTTCWPPTTAPTGSSPRAASAAR